MLRSYWLPIVAAVGFLSFGGLLASGYYVLWQAQQQPYTQDTYQPSRDARFPAPVKNAEASTNTYEPNCQAPQHYRDADLCAQWGSVKVGEEGNRLARISTRVTYLEFVGLVISLIFTGWAAMAASKGTSTANRAIKQSEEHARIGLRAYLAIQPNTVEFSVIAKDGGKGFIEVKVGCAMINSGNTPAEDVRVCADIRVGAWPPAQGVFDYDGIPEAQTNQSIGKAPGSLQRFAKPILVDFARLKSGEDRVILVGKLTYRDVWKTEYPSTFECSLIEVRELVEACEASIPGTGPVAIKNSPSFEWYRPKTAEQQLERKK